MDKKKYTHELKKDEYEKFKKLCKENNSTAVQEIRKFIKKYNEENKG